MKLIKEFVVKYIAGVVLLQFYDNTIKRAYVDELVESTGMDLEKIREEFLTLKGIDGAITYGREYDNLFKTLNVGKNLDLSGLITPSEPSNPTVTESLAVEKKITWEKHAVNSSAVKAVAYSPQIQAIKVWTHHSEEPYIYDVSCEDNPKDIYHDFKQAYSVGRYWNKEIKCYHRVNAFGIADNYKGATYYSTIYKRIHLFDEYGYCETMPCQKVDCSDRLKEILNIPF